MKLIIVQGAPATGKSSIAKKLVEATGYPHTFKDDYKENQYDLLGRTPTFKEWRQLDVDSWDRIYAAVKKAQKEDTDLVIEGNFKSSHMRHMREIVRPDTNVAELYIFSRGWTAFRRHIHRNRTGERHKGHRDRILYPLAFFITLFGINMYKPLRLSNKILEIDTTDFSKVDYKKIADFVLSA